MPCRRECIFEGEGWIRSTFPIVQDLSQPGALSVQGWDLTIAQFVENHNYYAKVYGINFGSKTLEKDGQWREKASDETIYLIVGYREMPQYHSTMKCGYVAGISFAIELKNDPDWLLSYNNHIYTQVILTVLFCAFIFRVALNPKELTCQRSHQCLAFFYFWGIRAYSTRT